MSRHVVLAVVALAIALPAGVGPGLAGATATDSVQPGMGSPAALTEVDLTPTTTEILEDTPTTTDGTASPTATAQPTDDDLLEDETDEVEDTVDDTVNETDELEETVDETDGVTSTLAGMLQGAVSDDGSLAVDGLVGVEADLNATTTPDDTPTPAASGAGSTTAAGAASGAPSSDDGGDAPVVPIVGGALLGGVAVAGLVARQFATGATTPGSSGLLAQSWARVRLEVAESAAGFRDRVGPLLGPFGYQRYDDSDPLEHAGRARLYEHVRDRPGTHLAALGEAADLPLSTARYHLRILEHEGLVRGEKRAGRRRYFPPDVDSDALAAALADEATAAVLRSLADGGQASVSELAERLDRDPSTVSHHLSRLANDGLVERERRGRAVVSSASPPVEVALRRDGLAERARRAANA